MATILKEHRYIVRIRDGEHVLRIQELISGTEEWPERIRVQLPASIHYRARTIYGITEKEVAEKAAAYLESPSP